MAGRKIRINAETKLVADLFIRTKLFALDVIRLYTSLPRVAEAQVLGRQVLRSGTSVGANYREAHRGRSHAEFTSKAGDCLREIEETGYWLELLDEIGLARGSRLERLRSECRELTAIFATIVRRAKAAEAREREQRRGRSKKTGALEEANPRDRG
jgi:four helix bundle protein